MLNNREIELAQKLKELTQKQKSLSEQQAQEVAADFGMSILQARYLLELAQQNSPELPNVIQRTNKR